MKPAPLKGKMWSDGLGDIVASKEQIRSAVEWLEIHVMNYTPDHNKPTIHNIIKEAFEDVMKR